MLSLVIGGARSGKSRFAQSICADARRVVYLATAQASDSEMAGRIARHRQDRPEHWLTVEEPFELGCAVERHAADCEFLLLDCLTLWLSNFCWIHRDTADDEILAATFSELARITAATAACHIVIVTNEVGCGLVPETALGRFFRDLHGWANQEVARSADWVFHLVAGLPTTIKQPGGSR